MAAVIVDTGLSTMLDSLNAKVGASYVIGLFKSNTTPSQATVWSDLTECDYHGYAQQALTGFAASGVAAHVASSLSTAYVFAFTAGAPTNTTVYGYFVKDTSTGDLIVAERFSSTKSMATVGDTITITPTDTLAAA